VSFDQALDLRSLMDRHDDDDFRDDAVFLLNVDRDCERFGEEIALDIGRGVFPVTSYDHGHRRADPLAPDGDFAAMDGMAAYLAPGALALVSVPVGPDRVFMNLMRRYGRVRLPLLLEGWEVLERVGWHEAMLDAAADGAGGSPGPSYEPVFVLRWRGDAAREL
jgi:hypothetical protein